MSNRHSWKKGYKHNDSVANYYTASLKKASMVKS